VNTYLTYIICLLSVYLTGSILFAYVITKLVKEESLISIYKGIPAKKQKNLNLVPKLKKSFPDYEFEEYYGGQYQYNYYITFE